MNPLKNRAIQRADTKGGDADKRFNSTLVRLRLVREPSVALQDTYWTVAGRVALFCLLIHASHLNNSLGVQLSAAIEYIRSRRLTELDNAVLSDDDKDVRESWRAFMGGTAKVEEHVREKVLIEIQTKLSGLRDKFLREDQISGFVEQLFCNA